jgi:hypothetical protein
MPRIFYPYGPDGLNPQKFFFEEVSGLNLSTDIEGGWPDDDNDRLGLDWASDPSRPDERAIEQALLDHDPISYKDTLLDNADDTIRLMFRGLGKLAPRDAAYAILGRYWKFGKTNEIDLSINNEQTAKAYVSSTQEWTALPTQARAFLVDMMTTMVIANFASLRLHADKITDR